jgi:hypothetical protein
MKSNLRTIQALQDYACAQQLIPRPMPVETLFFDPGTL